MSATLAKSNARPRLRDRLRPSALLRALKVGVSRLFEPAPATLGDYQQRRAPARALIRKLTVVGLIIFTGMIYGFLVAIFPMFLYLYMAIPIALLAVLIVWALPETENPPVKAIEWLFWAFFLSLFLWPNYLAIALPGLPWITMMRLWSGPMTLLLLVGLSISPTMRGELKAIFAESKWISRLLFGFVIIQGITIAFSPHPADSLNRFVANQLEWTAIFVVGALVFVKAGRVERWAQWFTLMAAFLACLAFFEWRKSGVLWAGHIPSFLAVADESVQRILAGGQRASTGIYRLQSTFSTSLNFAEFLGLSTVFFIHAFVKTRNQFLRLAILIYMPWHFWVVWCTDSRLGMVGFFGSFLLYLLAWSARRWRSRRDDLIGPALVLAYPAIVSAFLVASLFWQRLNRMIWGGGAQQASNDSRKAQWSMLWPKLGKWPFGHGPGQAGDSLGFANSGGTVTVDSYYISVLIEYGIIGFFLFYGLLMTGVVQSFRLGIQSKDEESHLMLPVCIALGLFIIIKGVLSQEDSHAMIFMMLGMVVAMTYRANRVKLTHG